MQITMAASISQSHARYHELDMNAPRLVARIKEVRRHLDAAANRKQLMKLENDLAQQGPFSTRKQALADAIEKLKHQIASESSQRQLETMLAELESQQSREATELASFRGVLALGRAQTLLPEILSEIFLHCQVPSPQDFNWDPLSVEMQTNLNVLRVCSTWRTAALSTPTLWCELHYADTGTLPVEFYHAWLRRAAAVPLDLNIWPYLGYGEDSYWTGAVDILHTHCRALGTLSLRLPVEDSGPPVPTLFPPPYQPTNLRNLTVYSYDECIHNTLSNIPWSQLLRLEFRDQYDTRFISPSQLAGIISQTVHLTHLVANLGPDPAFGPSLARVLPLPQLRTLDISWIDNETQFDGIVPHSFIDLFDKLLVPALKSLTMATSRDAHAFVLPALTSLAARSEFLLKSLHIRMWTANHISSVVFPMDTVVGFLRDVPTLSSLHWSSSGLKLSGLVEALTYVAADHPLLPNLVDISLEFDGYDGLLPAFADMVTSRRASNTQPSTAASLRHFHLKAAVPYATHSVSDAGRGRGRGRIFTGNNSRGPTVPHQIKTANEEAFARLEKLLTIADTNTPLRGSLDFQHFDQKLVLAEQEPAVQENFIQLAQVDGENFLHCNDELAWHWVDWPTLYSRQKAEGLHL
ncbi:F-box domain-containing protein [Mycena sanguinolenta]|uniref:F-box domain-containing protein n=1 Tax=Mycena sanguinolenta TaxID=230812 RepID=A0A8H7CLZ9_9AGAR|nr:F-box domain-containing protein [Mycena sanguinolenta]